jgi:lipopolysaccharide export LptBFGC system permease protein LptF
MDALSIRYNSMLQNKIYQNFTIEIFKTFFIILFGLSMIALTVRAVGFLELIVDSGYPAQIYFKYSLLNLFGVTTKFVPFAFFLAITLFILKHHDNSEFSILWSAGVKKIKVVNLFLLIGIITMSLYLIFSTYITPLALNKSRKLLNTEQFNSFLPTIKQQQFSDSFKGFTMIVEEKKGNKIKNIFLHDKENNLKALSSNASSIENTTIVAKKGEINSKQMILIEGQIISSKKNSKKNEMIEFDQLNINLGDLSTAIIKQPKIQELSTLKLISCFQRQFDKKLCNENFIKEIIPNLNRRIILPMYIPVISLICSLLLIRNEKNSLKKFSIYSMAFILILFTEIAIKYTGISNFLLFFFILFPFFLIGFFYIFLMFKFSNEY